ncbi:MAG TPA: insulinase family protein [Proteobacteria bacterium]|nr:peptidase M16 inactive domain protein [bacterium BMS3Abin14]HDL54156.1 insulinase family protein [Pseudomonadota bacterium]
MMSSIRQKTWACIFLVVVVGFPAISPALPSASEVTGYHVLENGLDVRLLPGQSTPMVATLVLVKTGYAREDLTDSGYSHLLEHLVFGGTASRDKDRIQREVRDLGGYINGFTRDDYTGYILVVHRDNLFKGLGLLSDMLFHSTLSESSVAEARRVVVEEIKRHESRPDARLNEMRQALLYAGSAYERTGLGNELTVTNVTREALLDYYRNTYRPNNMILLMAGGFNASSALDSLGKTFGRESAGGFLSKVVPPPPLEGKRVFFLRTGLPDIRIMLGFNGPAPRGDDSETLDLLSEVLGGSGGLLQRALENAGMTLRGVSAALAINQGFSRYVISVTLPEGSDPQAALQVVLEAIPDAMKAGLPEDIVNNARESLVSGEIMGMEKVHYYLMGKASWAVDGSAGQGFSPGRWDNLGPGDLERAAGKYLEDRPYVALIAVPNRASGATTGTSDLKRRAEATLANGLTVVAEQRPESQVFALHLITRHRSSLEPEGKAGISGFLFRMFTEGTFERSREEIQSLIRQLGISFSTAGNPISPFGDFYTSRTYSYLRMECLQENAKKATGLVADMLQNPLLAEDRIEAVRSRILDFIAYKDAVPEDVASKELARSLYGGILSPDVLGTRESVSSISEADLRAFHGAFITGRNIIVSVVSGLPPKDAIAIVESYLSDLPPGQGCMDPNLSPTKGAVLVMRDLGKPQGALALGALGPGVDPGDRPAMAVVSGLLNQRLYKNLREKEGLAYSVGASVGDLYGRDLFVLSMGTSPEKMERARVDARREIDGAKFLEVTPAELKNMVNAMTGRLQMRMMSSINRAFYLGLAKRNGLKHTFGDDYRKILLDLTPADVKRAAAKYIPDSDLLVEVVVR